MTQVTNSGYVRRPDGSYLKKSMPPVEFAYTQARIDDEVREVDAASLADMPLGASAYQWLDLDGEGTAGLLAEQPGAWFYKRNVSPLAEASETPTARFDPVTEQASLPSFADAPAWRHQFLDLAGDGRLDCVVLERPVPGFFERTDEEDWDPFAPLTSFPDLDWSEPNLRFLDLTGDGHADVAVTGDDVLTWDPSLAEDGFGAAVRVPRPADGHEDPAAVFADGDQNVFAADMSGDGLADIVRVRNGEVCYWPNLGYGRFGARVVMDGGPWFDAPDGFDPRRLRLADIDGSGPTDIVYLAASGVRLYFNEAGNGWSEPRSRARRAARTGGSPPSPPPHTPLRPPWLGASQGHGPRGSKFGCRAGVSFRVPSTTPYYPARHLALVDLQQQQSATTDAVESTPLAS